MDSTLSELEDRLTPRELMRDGIDSLSGLEASQYVFKLAGLARRYPMPAAVAGASLAGLFLAGRRQYKNRFSDRETVADSDRSSARLSKVLESAKEKLQDTRQTLTQSAGAARDKLSGATSGAMGRASEFAGRAGEFAGRAGEFAGSAGKQLRRAGAGAQTIARERPVAVGALALALAAGIAMSIPSVRRKIY
jgi:hypothetical protein